MEWVILQTLYWVGPDLEESYSKLWKQMSSKLLATIISAISLHSLWGLTYRDTKYCPRLHWPYSIRSSVASVPPTSFVASQNASSTQGFTFRVVCCLSYAMIDIDPGETLIVVILPSSTVPCSSLCMIILYGRSPLSLSRINTSQATCMALC